MGTGSAVAVEVFVEPGEDSSPVGYGYAGSDEVAASAVVVTYCFVEVSVPDDAECVGRVGLCLVRVVEASEYGAGTLE